MHLDFNGKEKTSYRETNHAGAQVVLLLVFLSRVNCSPSYYYLQWYYTYS